MHTHFCTSSSPSIIKQVWFCGCYSFYGESRLTVQFSSSPSKPLNCTTKRKTENYSSSTELIPLCGIILSLVILNLVIILEDFYLSFHYCIVSIFKSFLPIISCIRISWAATASGKRRIEKRYTGRNILVETEVNKPEENDQSLSLLEVKRVIEGTLCNQESCEIEGLFEEEEPSLKEVKEAFDVFDENKDGFIDAKEIGNVLVSLGFLQEASEEDCKRMIKAFDDDLDGRIGLSEFTKVLERSFC